MYCSHCGTKNTKNASFCVQCGRPMEHGKPAPQPVTQDHRTAQTQQGTDWLIGWGWILTATGLFVTAANAGLAILISLLTLVISIALIKSPIPNRKMHGKILIAIWLIINAIAFVVAFNQQANGGV